MAFACSAPSGPSLTASTPSASASSTIRSRPPAEPPAAKRLPFAVGPRHTARPQSAQGRKSMAIQRIDVGQGPGPRMSRAVVHDNRVFLAGLTARDTSQDIQSQTKQNLDKIDDYLKQAGASKSNLLTANLWIKDMAMFSAMNEIWNAWVDPANP